MHLARVEGRGEGLLIAKGDGADLRRIFWEDVSEMNRRGEGEMGIRKLLRCGTKTKPHAPMLGGRLEIVDIAGELARSKAICCGMLIPKPYLVLRFPVLFDELRNDPKHHLELLVFLVQSTACVHVRPAHILTPLELDFAFAYQLLILKPHSFLGHREAAGNAPAELIQLLLGLSLGTPVGTPAALCARDRGVLTIACRKSSTPRITAFARLTQFW